MSTNKLPSLYRNKSKKVKIFSLKKRMYFTMVGGGFRYGKSGVIKQILTKNTASNLFKSQNTEFPSDKKMLSTDG